MNPQVAYFHLLLSPNYRAVYLLNRNCLLFVKSQANKIKQIASFPKGQPKI